jgi:transmembrane sensor
MDELIFRVLRGEATQFEKERLKKWRAQDPGNEARFKALAGIWELTSQGDTARVHPGEVEQMAESVVATAELRRAKQAHTLSRASRRSRRKAYARSLAPWGAALAAGVAAVALGIRSNEPGPGPTPTSAPDLSIGLTSQTLRLDDGSFVRLSPGSRLEAQLGESRRIVSLDGRAFFAVAPDSGRPFVVSTDRGRVRVLGTRFEVSEEAEGLRTVVVEGSVRLSTDDGQVDVPGGSVGYGNPGRAPTSVQMEDIFSLLDWPGGVLVFHDTPLPDVAREVARQFGTSVRIEAPARPAPRVSASFEGGETFQEIMETLCSVTRSLCRISGDSAVVGPPSGEPR